MAYNMVVRDAENITHLTMKADTFVKRGDLLGYSSGWVKADADTASDIFAQWVALEDGGDEQTIQVCKKCTFHDEDAPYTANTSQYLSGTAGGITETRPATDNDLIQVVGRSLGTSRVRIEIEAPKEFEIFLTPDQKDGTGEPGLGTVDTAWVGPQVDAAAETVYIKGRLPSGLVGSISCARAIFNVIGASAFDNDVTVTGGHDGASNAEDTGAGITAGDWSADTDNLLAYQDVSACFDSGFYKPGMNFCVLLDPDGITGDAQVIGLYIRGWKV